MFAKCSYLAWFYEQTLYGAQQGYPPFVSPGLQIPTVGGNDHSALPTRQ